MGYNRRIPITYKTARIVPHHLQSASLCGTWQSKHKFRTFSPPGLGNRPRLANKAPVELANTAPVTHPVGGYLQESRLRAMASPKLGIVNSFEFFDNYDVCTCCNDDDIPVGSIVACFEPGQQYPSVLGTVAFAGRTKLPKINGEEHPDGEFGDVFVVPCFKPLRKKKKLQEQSGWWRKEEVYIFPLEGHYLAEDRYCESVVYSGHDPRTRREELKLNWTVTIVVPDATVRANEAVAAAAEEAAAESAEEDAEEDAEKNESDDSNSESSAEVVPPPPRRVKQTARKSQVKQSKTKQTGVKSRKRKGPKRTKSKSAKSQNDSASDSDVEVVARKTQDAKSKPQQTGVKAGKRKGPKRTKIQSRKSRKKKPRSTPTRQSKRLRANSTADDADASAPKRPASKSAHADSAVDTPDETPDNSDDPNYVPEKEKSTGGMRPSKAALEKFRKRTAQIEADFDKFMGSSAAAEAGFTGSSASAEAASEKTADDASATTTTAAAKPTALQV